MSEENVMRFIGKYRFLSNFWPAQIRGPGNLDYPTVEHAYQASKCAHVNEYTTFNSPLLSAGQAKRLGRKIVMRGDWDAIKLMVMEKFLRQKFAYRSVLGIQLAAITGEIVEGNTWGDTFWGVDASGNGFNHLGRILMKIRDEHRYADGDGDII